MSLHRFRVGAEALLADEAEISGAEFRHLRARRVRPGESIEVADGRGSMRPGVVIEVGDDRARVRFSRAIEHVPMLRPIRLAVGILKGERLDWAVEKATELGVAEIFLIRAARSIADVSDNRLKRLERIADAAAKQSHAPVAPVVHPPRSLESLLAEPLRHLVCWEESKRPLPEALAELPSEPGLLVWIGPEGGFEAREVEAIRAAGGIDASLGERPLRAETAVVVALARCIAGEEGDS